MGGASPCTERTTKRSGSAPAREPPDLEVTAVFDPQAAVQRRRLALLDPQLAALLQPHSQRRPAPC